MLILESFWHMIGTIGVYCLYLPNSVFKESRFLSYKFSLKSKTFRIKIKNLQIDFWK